MSRKSNTIRNIKFGMINKIIMLFFPFIMRTIIITKLGGEYAGLNSLFTSILQVLNLAELGIGSAITFSLYKPLAEKQTDIVCSIMNLYKKIYRIIGLIILIVGLILLPFLSFFIKGSVPNNINIYILYCIYLFNTVLTYFLYSYKIILLEANQRNDIISNINTVLYIIQFIYQIIVIFCFKNYYLYIIIMPFITIANNLIGAIYSKKLFPEYYCKGIVDDDRKKDIKKRVYGLMIQKVCATTRNSLDSIFVSSFLGLSLVAMYNNYFMVSNAVVGLLSVFVLSMTASVGNSIAIETKKKNFEDMNKINFIYMWISGLCTICLLCLYQPFMKFWLGEEYLFNFSTVILFCIYFYSLKMGDVLSIYLQGAGLWWEGKYRALVESFLNLILNFILGKKFGVNGIILGTLISLLLINFIYGSTIIFKHYFTDEKVINYYLKHLLYMLITLIISIVTYYITTFIQLSGLLNLIIIAIICLVVPNILYYIFYRKYYLFDISKEFCLGIIKKKVI